jgi:hypothetical protein
MSLKLRFVGLEMLVIQSWAIISYALIKMNFNHILEVSEVLLLKIKNYSLI